MSAERRPPAPHVSASHRPRRARSMALYSALYVGVVVVGLWVVNQGAAVLADLLYRAVG